MNLILSGRGVQLDDRLRGYAAEKLTKVQRFFDRIIKMEVELRHERNPRVAQRDRVVVTVTTPRDSFRAEGQGIDAFAAIDVAADKLEEQIRRFKDKLKDHPHRGNNNSRADRRPTAVEADPDDGPIVVRQTQQIAKPMTPEEAAIELEGRGLAFMLFTNAETMSSAVLYRRTDGAYGLVEQPG